MKTIHGWNNIKYSKITNVTLGGVDSKDYPKFTDAYIQDADYEGFPMSEKQLNEINKDHSFVHECVIKNYF